MKFRIKPACILVLVILCLTLFGSVVAAQGFSADVISYFGKETSKGKIYIADQKMRFEIAGTVSITRMDKKVVWLLMPSQKMYMEQGIKLQNIIPDSAPGPNEVERTFLGNETVNGYNCSKYRITVNVDNQKQSFLQWQSEQGFPVKIASEDGKWAQEYRNISLNTPAANLFEIPEGYQKFGMSIW